MIEERNENTVGWTVEVTGGRRRGRRGIVDRATASYYWVRFDEPDRDGISLKRVWKLNTKVLYHQLLQPLAIAHHKKSSCNQRDGIAVCSGQEDDSLVELIRSQLYTFENKIEELAADVKELRNSLERLHLASSVSIVMEQKKHHVQS